MYDIDGTELVPGDRVLWCEYSRYGGLGFYYVHSFTPKMVRISNEQGGQVYSVVSPGRLIKTLRQL